MRFTDRADAGRQLAQRLTPLRGSDIIVLGLPRGGVPVAFEVAQALDAPLDVLIVRKLGWPANPEVAMGAIGEGGFEVLDRSLISEGHLTREQVAEVVRREQAILQARLKQLRPGGARLDLTGRTAVIVDDGLATGASASVACQVARHLGANRVVLAIPVAPRQALAGFRGADEIVCLSTPTPFWAVGQQYEDFSPTSDAEVVDLLQRAQGGIEHEVTIPVPSDGVTLGAHLDVPANAKGIVVFAHGSGSSRHSSRNQYVAHVLREAGLGTLLLDLLAATEEHDRAKVFDIPLLAGRLVAAVKWLSTNPETDGLRVGFFGASTGAGAALWAASTPGVEVDAVVSRGGRPDLADGRLGHVGAPTLLIVGSADPAVLRMNQEAQARMRCETQLAVVPGAGHLFEEPGALPAVATMARDWFQHHLVTDHGRAAGF
jgi:putative phosphoribosyl transferase